MILFANRIAKIIKTEKIEVVSAYHLYAGLAALPAVKRKNIPLVTTIFGEIFSERNLYLHITDQVKHVLEYSDDILSCSMHCGKSIEKIGLNHKVHTHYYGIDTSYFNRGVETIFSRKKFNWNDEDRIIIFVGRMNQSLGLDTLLEAVPSLINANNRIRFLICGAKGSLTPEALKTESQYPDNVRVLVNVDTESLRNCYLISDLAVAPSINDRACLGLAIIEAMSSGLPVVACNVGGTAEVVDDGDTGLLVPPRDPVALGKAITTLLNDDELRRKMSSKGRKVAVKKFELQTSNQFALRKFEKLITGARGKSDK